MAPYRYEPYENRLAGSISDMMARRGEIRARAALQSSDAQANAAAQSGQIWGNAINNIGQSIAAIPAQMQQAERQKAAATEDAMRAKVLQGQIAAQQQEQATAQRRSSAMQRTSRADVLEALKADPQGYKMASEHFQAIDDNLARTMGSAAAGVRAFKDSPQAAIAALDDLIDQGFDEKRMTQLRMQIVERPEAITQLVDSLLAKSPDESHRRMVSAVAKPVEVKTREIETVDDSGNIVKRIVKDEPGQSFPVPPKAEPKETNPTEASLAAMAARGDQQAVKALALLRAQREKPASADSRLWIVRNGETMRVSEGEIRPGDRPANTREQGRPVTSGDASDLADFDTSLDELKAVRAAISDKDSTGIVARVGATLPYVTQITGWGADAKKRQAVIDRVKQVIGKTLEGGVLRKEDEAKYEKILPNIGDAPEVAASKLDGLDAAIKKRKQRRLDNLADANYDVSKQKARATDAAANPGGAPMRRAIPGIEGGIAESNDGGKTWKRVQ